MRFLRIVLGYVLACVAAVTVLFSFQRNIINVIADFAATWPKFIEFAQTLAVLTAVIGGVIFIPALIFLTSTWERRGPSLASCLFFGGLGGTASCALILLIVFAGTGDFGLIKLFLFLIPECGASGLVAALTFWFVAVWPRPPELPEDAT